MFQLVNGSKSFGGRNLFSKATVHMEKGEKLGLLGRNGSGKSTLLKIILGEESLDEGDLIYPKNYSIGHLSQHLEFKYPTLLEEGACALPDNEKEMLYKVERILFGLGFKQSDLQKKPTDFSGGFQIRINLAKCLLQDPDLLLLDEPTNYLDIVARRWLIRFLQSWPKELILITHEQDFLDAVVSHCAIIHRQQVKMIKGNSQKLYEQIALDEEIYEKTRVNEEKKIKEVERFVERFRAKATKAAQVQSRVKSLEKMDRKDKLTDEQNLSLSFPYTDMPGKVVTHVSDLGFHYPNGPQLIDHLNFKVEKKDRLAIIGKNGKGKSTLLNLMAQELASTQGEIKYHPQAQFGFFGQTNINRLHPESNVEEEIRSLDSSLTTTNVRNICGMMMFSGDDALKKIKVLSGGEKARVLLGKILAQKTNILFLDEPTHHLDMQSVASLVESIKSFPGAVVLVTHHEGVLKAVAERLVVFKESGPEVFEGTYDEFLEKEGWEDESNALSNSDENNKAQQESTRKKRFANKQLRQQLIQERSKSLRPLLKKQEFYENEILTLEEKKDSLSHQMISASQSGQGHEMGQLNKEYSEVESKLEEHYLSLDEVIAKVEEIQEDYALKLESLES